VLFSKNAAVFGFTISIAYPLTADTLRKSGDMHACAYFRLPDFVNIPYNVMMLCGGCSKGKSIVVSLKIVIKVI